MATSTEVKAPQTAAFTDASLDVAPGDTVYIHTDDAAGIPANESVMFYYDNAALDSPAFTLRGGERIQAIGGYAKLIGKKAATSVKIGVGKYSS